MNCCGLLVEVPIPTTYQKERVIGGHRGKKLMEALAPYMGSNIVARGGGFRLNLQSMTATSQSLKSDGQMRL